MEYIVEYQEVVIFNPEPLSKNKLRFDAESFEEAAVKAIRPLTHTSAHMDVYNATIIGPDKSEYPILEKGTWLIDTETGKQLSELEEDVLDNQ
jgi:hypothetical protein